MNPDFPLTVDDARRAIAEMRRHPVAPVRPIVVAGGLLDPGLIVGRLSCALETMLADPSQLQTVTFMTTLTFERCRDRLIDAVQQRWPSESTDETIEIDVVAHSMGGLVARHAAMPRDDGRRLRIARLLTIATPHRGARLAPLAMFDSRARGMRAGSAFLKAIDAHLDARAYELFCYTRLNDLIVGSANTAPVGHSPWWVPNVPLGLGHVGAVCDPRIQADIARRLRGEPAWTGRQSTTLCNDEPAKPMTATD